MKGNFHSTSPALDYIELEKYEPDFTKIDYKINANLYDEIEIIEDETVPFSPVLSDSYNKTNLFYALGTEDPILQKKLEYAKQKRDQITSYGNLNPKRTISKLRMWSNHLLDEEALEVITKEDKRKNIRPRTEQIFDSSPKVCCKYNE